jgi:hypothetical protein
MTELLKNAKYAVLKRHSHASTLPPVHVTLCRNEQEVVIRVSDQGAAFSCPPSRLFHICAQVVDFLPKSRTLCGTTTSPRANLVRVCMCACGHKPVTVAFSQRTLDTLPAQLVFVCLIKFLIRSRLCCAEGLGFGLPLSRLYAEYFGGSLKGKRDPSPPHDSL